MQEELFKATVGAGQSAMKAAMAINGGGAVALLAFIGHLATSPSSGNLVAKFATPLWIFSLGVLVSTIAIGANYFGQAFFTLAQRSSIGWHLNFAHGINFVVIILVMMSYCFFGYSIYYCTEVFSNFAEMNSPPTPPQLKNYPLWSYW